MQAQLYIIDGPRRGERFPLQVDGTIIGRDPAEGIDIALYDARVSSRHARLEFDSSFGWTIEDLESTNGTRVDGEPVSNPVLLGPGSRILFGEGCTATFEPSANEPVPLTPTPGTVPTGVGEAASRATIDNSLMSDLRDAVELLGVRCEDARGFVGELRRIVGELERATAGPEGELSRMVRQHVTQGGEMREMVRDLDEMIEGFAQAVRYFDESLK